MLLYIFLKVTTNQKYILDTHVKKINESKHNTKDSHQITMEKSKRRMEQKRTTKTQKQPNGNTPMNNYLVFFFFFLVFLILIFGDAAWPAGS